uniref:Alpha-type protein kinase domain-containing protein n=1 Tax=Chaetoceros debilis TaxID=122233 RepID=A0A7S3PWP2_9STRA|mmetsp:Transcript_13437/g.19986  ORF Transcript_13437/g.19986 Transcript_13437/m.19986 type:complete len:133 (+) Transcript_13437:2-400(+)
MQNLDLGMLEEGDEEEESDNDSEDETIEVERRAPTIIFSPSEVAQAFSHFSYWATGRKRLVCDIQGVFCEEVNKLRLSDPVIHYYNSKKDGRKMVHGRTDRGRKGFAMFFETHDCSRLCRLVTKGFKRPARA